MERPTVLTFQVTENLEVGEELALQLFDAATDRLLAESVARVDASVEVEEEL